MPRLDSLISVLLLGVVLCACSDDANSGSAGGAGASGGAGGAALLALGSELQGIYQITEHHLNLDGCEADESKVSGHAFLALYTLSSGTLGNVNVISCTDVEACRASVDAATHARVFSFNFRYVFDTSIDADSIAGRHSDNVRQGAECYQATQDVTLVRSAATTFGIEARIWNGEHYAPNAADSCSGHTEDLMSGGRPCTQFESLSATRVAAL